MKSKLNLIVGVTGGVAAYKAVQLVSFCKKNGFEVKVIMTKTAEEFIKPLTFESMINEHEGSRQNHLMSNNALNQSCIKCGEILSTIKFLLLRETCPQIPFPNGMCV